MSVLLTCLWPGERASGRVNRAGSAPQARKYARCEPMILRAWPCILLCGALGTAGCRTQQAEAPAAPDDAEQPEQELEAGSPEAHEPVAAASDEEGEDEGPNIEEQLALEAVRNDLQSAARRAEEAGPEPLRFAVVQRGPHQPWVMGVVNQGENMVSLIADPRLIAFDVKVPGKKQTAKCELPDALRPARGHRRYRVQLAPGEGVVKTFDPRLYCFAASGQRVLVPGAIVTPRFGWPEKTKTVWKGGKKEQVLLEQSEPFVARILPEQEVDETSGGDSEDEAVETAPLSEAEGKQTNGIKQLKAPAIALDSEYKEWSSVGIQRKRPLRSPIVIDMQQGSDAGSQLSATVAIALRNRGERTRYVYFRRELLSFEVMGPGGLTSCDPQPDTRAPDRLAFLRLAPGQSMTITSRLVELCPKGTFSRPGFYLVHARFEADHNGEEFGMDAYVGRVASEKPANVRIRSGELEPEDRQAMRPFKILE